MKKYLWALVSIALTISACEEMPKVETENGEENTETPSKPETPGDEEPSEPAGPSAELTPSAQKSKLQDVGKKIMDMCPPEEFTSTADLLEKFSEAYFTETYNWDDLSVWFDNAIDTGFKTQENGELKGNTYKYEFLADMVILLSDHTGILTLGKDAAKLTESNETKIVFSLDGKNYEAVLTSKGKVTEAFFSYKFNEESNSYGYHDYETNSWISTEDIIKHERHETINVTVGVPEEITMEITENGSPLATVNAKFSPNFTEAGLEPTVDSFAMELSFSFNGYEFILSTLSYKGASGKAEFGHSFKKDGVCIYSSKASGDIKFDITTLEDSWGEDNAYSFTTVEFKTANNFSASVDILGEIQARGTCSDAMELSEAFNDFWDAIYSEYGADETAAKRALNNVNAKFDVGIYYDNGNNKQADIEFEYSHSRQQCDWDVNYDGFVNQDDVIERYGYETVIVFNDGSRYSIEDYFTEDAFSSLIEHAEEFAEAFEEVFAYFIEGKTVDVPMTPIN